MPESNPKNRTFGRIFWRVTKWSLMTLGVLLVIGYIYLLSVAYVEPPVPSHLEAEAWTRTKINDSTFTIENNWFRESESNLHEMYLEGEPFDRGVANGKLTSELCYYQEKVFTDQIENTVSSGFQRSFLRYFLGWFNRNLDESIQDEYKLEIFGVSQSSSHDFDYVAPPYQRILNYHAAHDIGHALQNMSLVGCTSFATWGKASADGSLIVGRNFDFYFGDEFAKHKIVAFVHPSSGHDFVMITFPGMIGVLSGMNMEGLTVTLNAAKSEIPTSSATPVSLVAREVLQYASNIDEAMTIIRKRKLFVSESFMIGSAADGKAVVIERTPDDFDVYDPNQNQIVCTNHFNGDSLGNTSLNIEHIKVSASDYRRNRVEELMNKKGPLTITKTADILRDRNGMNDVNIGLGNEKAINQLIAHHSIIFQPERKRFWISTSPWQLGEYRCYDLSAGIAGITYDHNLKIDSLSIAEDPFVHTPEMKAYLKFSRYRFPFASRDSLDPDSLVVWNSGSYLSYMIAADELFKRKEYSKAIPFYEKGLQLEIASQAERDHMKSNLENCKKKIR